MRAEMTSRMDGNVDGSVDAPSIRPRFRPFCRVFVDGWTEARAFRPRFRPREVLKQLAVTPKWTDGRNFLTRAQARVRVCVHTGGGVGV
jgi:hypothetical protein